MTTVIGAPSVIEQPQVRARFIEMYQQRVGYDRLAEEFGVVPETARRWAMRLGLRDKVERRMPTFTQQQIQDAADGIPATWNCEGSGFTEMPFRRMAARLASPYDRLREWKSAWNEIRRRPELLELHKEFAPRRSSKTSSGLH
jgi:hypothetical protein